MRESPERGKWNFLAMLAADHVPHAQTRSLAKKTRLTMGTLHKSENATSVNSAQRKTRRKVCAAPSRSEP